MENFIFCAVLQSAIEPQFFCEDTHLHNFINIDMTNLKYILLFKKIVSSNLQKPHFYKKKNALTYLYDRL